MSKKPMDITGQKFGKLTAVERVGKAGAESLWLCKCDCGNEKTIRLGNLRKGTTVSCKCQHTDRLLTMDRVTHGLTGTPEYISWASMIQRCENPKSRGYQNYGGRGIKICKRWRNSFENFLSDMGKRPTPTHSLDRIDVDSDYEPKNCRWATPKEQRNNQRKK